MTAAISRPNDLLKRLENTRLRLMGAISQAEMERRNRQMDDRQEELEIDIGAATENRRTA